MTDTNKNLIPEHSDKAVAEVFTALSHPLAENIGNTLGDLWYLVFGGISHQADLRRAKYAESVSEFKSELSSKINAIPPEDLKEPDVQIAGQALEKSKYCVENDTLRNMFSSLITSSMMSSKESSIHPSFAEIITQMTSDDAKALLSFENGSIKPILKFVLAFDGSAVYNPLVSNIWVPCYSVNEIEKCQIITDSLLRLGLVEITYSEHLSREDAYDGINNQKVIDFLNNYVISSVDFDSEHPREKCKVDTKKGTISLTNLGHNFLRCVR